jgi:hypothetical protein
VQYTIEEVTMLASFPWDEATVERLREKGQEQLRERNRQSAIR